MRKANVNDLFNVARLLNDLNLKEDIFKAQKGEEDVEKVGFNIIFDILSKATTKESQQKIYECLAQPFEINVGDVGQMGIMDIVEAFNQCFDFKTLANFINRVNK